MSPCFICEIVLASTNSHHIIPQASGGTEGPEISLCATCHGVIHAAALAMSRGKSGEKHLAHLTDEGKQRARGLIQIILLAKLAQPNNPNPLVSVVLESPSYLDALKRYQADCGFSSQAAAINGMLRTLAIRYGLLDEKAVASVREVVKLSDLRMKSTS